MARTDSASLIVAAPPDVIYQAFAEDDRLMAWLPPGGMSGRALEYDFREGGRYRIELTHDAGGAGKTTARSDVTGGRFRSLQPGRRIVWSVEFESQDAAFAGEMVMTWNLEPVTAGTRVTVTAENVPPGITAADHDAGLRASLANLARHVGPRLPALDPASLVPRTGSMYPEPFRSRVTPREKRALGDATGLTMIGVNLTTLLPGKESSMRHHHSREDELVFILEGEVVLRTDEGEQRLTAGMCAGFPASSTNAHQLVNRSDRPARYLEISNRDRTDVPVYPDDDLAYALRPDGTAVFTRKDGSRY